MLGLCGGKGSNRARLDNSWTSPYYIYVYPVENWKKEGRLLMIRSFGLRLRETMRAMRPAQIITLMFLAVIFLGAAVLTLPAASAAGKPTDFLTCLFTATSATCVTGLSVVETGLHWSVFGQWVILLLIQIGGLGFMSILAVFSLALRRRIGLKKQMVLAQALGAPEMRGVVRLVRNVVLGTLAVEGVGAALLSLCFVRRFPFWTALRYGVFHAVSAYCNAGFDVLADVEAGGSLCAYAADPAVNFIIMALITIGGLGFLVWGELRRMRRFSELSVYARLVLVISALLTFGGAALIALLEWNNPLTLGTMPVWEKLMAALFQSVTTRTAGFFTIPQTGLSDAAMAVSDVLMFIGGSSGSTAGGLKTVTFGVVLFAAVGTARGRTKVSVWRHGITQEQINQAMTLLMLMLSLSFAGAVFVSASSGCSLSAALYETVSALATVGLTAGLTPTLGIAAKLLLIVFMFFGRVGIMTIGVAFMTGNRPQERFAYASAKLLIG